MILVRMIHTHIHTRFRFWKYAWRIAAIACRRATRRAVMSYRVRTFNLAVEGRTIGVMVLDT